MVWFGMVMLALFCVLVVDVFAAITLDYLIHYDTHLE